MSRTRKVFLNSAILTIQQVLLNIISIFIVGYTARKLGHEDYGIYSLAFAFQAIFLFLGSFGLRPLTIRELARNREAAFDFLGKIIPARIIFIGLMVITVILSAFLLDYDRRIIVAIVITIGGCVFDQLSRIILDVFQAFEEMGKVAIRDIIVRIFTAIATVAILLVGYGLYHVCFVYTAGALLGLIINIYLYLKRFPCPRIIFDYDFIRISVKEGGSYLVIGLASVLYTKIDVVLLSKMTDNATVGIYSASANLFYRLNFIADAIATAVFPAVSQLYWTDKVEANNVFSKSFFAIVLISVPVTVGGLILSDELITFIYGNSYHGTVRIFAIMVCSIPFLFLSTLFNFTLGAIGEQRFVAKVLVATTAVNLILNIIFISLFGPEGAAGALLLTHLLCFFALWVGIRNYLSLKLSLKQIISVLLSVVVLAVVTYLLKPIGILITIPTAVLVYYICLRVTGVYRLRFDYC